MRPRLTLVRISATVLMSAIVLVACGDNVISDPEGEIEVTFPEDGGVVNGDPLIIKGTFEHGLNCCSGVEVALARLELQDRCFWYRRDLGEFTPGRCSRPAWTLAHDIASGQSDERWLYEVPQLLPGSYVLRVRSTHPGAYDPAIVTDFQVE